MAIVKYFFAKPAIQSPLLHVHSFISIEDHSLAYFEWFGPFSSFIRTKTMSHQNWMKKKIFFFCQLCIIAYWWLQIMWSSQQMHFTSFDVSTEQSIGYLSHSLFNRKKTKNEISFSSSCDNNEKHKCKKMNYRVVFLSSFLSLHKFRIDEWNKYSFIRLAINKSIKMFFCYSVSSLSDNWNGFQHTVSGDKCRTKFSNPRW